MDDCADIPYVCERNRIGSISRFNCRRYFCNSIVSPSTAPFTALLFSSHATVSIRTYPLNHLFPRARDLLSQGREEGSASFVLFISSSSTCLALVGLIPSLQIRTIAAKWHLLRAASPFSRHRRFCIQAAKSHSLYLILLPSFPSHLREKLIFSKPILFPVILIIDLVALVKRFEKSKNKTKRMLEIRCNLSLIQS